MNPQPRRLPETMEASRLPAHGTMRAIRVDRYGSPSVLIPDQVPRPAPRRDQVLLDVSAAGVNPIDYRIRQGSLRWLLPARFPIVPGFDVAGTIAELGFGLADSGWNVGDAVLCFLDNRLGGGYARYAIASAGVLARKPDNVSFVEAAATPLAGSTALQALRDLGHLGPGQRVLINGASGGVGSFATQLAREFGAHVTGVCSERNLEFVRELGADQVLDYQRQDFTRSDQPYDIVFDVAAKSSYQASRRVLKPRGHYITTVPSPSSLVFQLLTWFHGPRCQLVLARPRGEDLRLLADLLEQRSIRPIVQDVLPLEQAPEAHRLLESGQVRGKLVLSIESKFESGLSHQGSVSRTAAEDRVQNQPDQG